MQKQKLLRLLRKEYPGARTELRFSGEYQLIVCVMLSAQATDKKVNEITPRLFSRFGSFAALSRGRLADIERLVRPINYYKTKARHLKAMADQIMRSYGGRLPRTHEELTSLPGVGAKTANVVLAECGVCPAFPVDTHVFRVSRRLGLADAATRDRVEAQLRAQFAPRHWRPLHHQLILHGRRICRARNPLCLQCPLLGLCPFGKERVSGRERC